MPTCDEAARMSRQIRATGLAGSIAWDPQATNYARALFGLPLSDPRAKG